MKIGIPARLFPVIFSCLFLFACDSQQPENAKQPRPQVFTPQEVDSTEINSDTISEIQESETVPEPAEPEVKQKPMPTVAELKKVTPSQEAKRELSKDAMQIYRMQPEAFFTYLKSRIPYYKGKGNLKAENDLVRIEITEKEMIVETPKGRQTFPME